MSTNHYNAERYPNVEIYEPVESRLSARRPTCNRSCISLNEKSKNDNFLNNHRTCTSNLIIDKYESFDNLNENVDKFNEFKNAEIEPLRAKRPAKSEY